MITKRLRVKRWIELVKKRKARRKQNAYRMSKDLLDATPALVVGTSVAGMIPKLYP